MLGPGAIAGLPASVSGNPYSLTAEVLQDSELAFVPRHLVVSFLKNNPILGFEVIRMLSSEICDARSVFKAKASNLPQQCEPRTASRHFHNADVSNELQQSETPQSHIQYD